MMIRSMHLLCAIAATAASFYSVPPPQPGSISSERLIADVERRAFRFFWEQADPRTGLVKDRADNHGPDTYVVASTASTGYALAALPAAVEHGWIGREEARNRAIMTLRFVREKM